MYDSDLKATWADGRYELPPLPYADTALQPLASAETLYLHHEKHHAAYVAGANAALETLLLVNEGRLSPSLAPAATQELVFNLSGHILHTLYWGNLCAQPQAGPGPAVAAAICESYGSFDAFERLFVAVALTVKGSGWGVLGVDPVSRRLMVIGIHSHHEVLLPGFRPLLVCDVWEHAYYLSWRNDRRGYLNAFMRQIDWNVVEQRFTKVCCHEY